MKPLDQCQLYTFVDMAYLHEHSPAEVAQQLCDGGSDLIQLRAKECSPNEIRRIAEQILPITERAGIGLVINDHIELALELGASMCHLGQEDFFAQGYATRSDLISHGSKLGLGLSSHAPEQAERAVKAGADYVAIGPVYSTPTKPSAVPVTLEYVRWASRCLETNWFAIGGIHLGNVDGVLSAGARRICVVSAILNALDIRAACQAFKKHLSYVPV